MEYVLQTPIRDEQIEKLRAGDIVHIKGMLFTARDEAHMHLLEHGLLAGFEPRGAALYHCGPVTRKTATGWEVVAAGPTTSFRMDSLEADFLARFGPKVVVGKGGMGARTQEALVRNKAVYVSFTGGAGALAARTLGRISAVHLLPELGMAEAIWVFDSPGFGPLIVTMDCHGRSLHQELDQSSLARAAEIKARI
ncbi:MAG: fumarate hydratase C-terminal domain-containing protein [Acidobacteria bacterium]|nr:fumarate hydratase C-terminal domain-containing protein [Acidobacteriota bacterium]